MNGIILASGFSTRMRKNKLLMKINNEEIISRVIKEVKKSNISYIILVAREKTILDIGKLEYVKVVVNKEAYLGQSSSIRLGINSSKIEEDFIFFCRDQPFIDFKSINKLIEVSKKSNESIIVPRMNERTGSPVIFPKIYKKELNLLTGDIVGREIIKNNKEKVIYVDIMNPLFLEDVDTKEDYMKLSKI